MKLAGASNIEIPTLQQENILDILEKKYPSFTPFQKGATRILARGVLNILLRTYTNPLLEQKLKQQVPIFEIILDKRNAIITKAILDSPVPNIYIHYGALHYAGVLKMLQENDPRWQEISRTEFQVIR